MQPILQQYSDVFRPPIHAIQLLLLQFRPQAVQTQPMHPPSTANNSSISPHPYKAPAMRTIQDGDKCVQILAPTRPLSFHSANFRPNLGQSDVTTPA